MSEGRGANAYPFETQALEVVAALPPLDEVLCSLAGSMVPAGSAEKAEVDFLLRSLSVCTGPWPAASHARRRSRGRP